MSEAGVKAGEIFVSSWGYDQTNVDFFKVLEDAPYGKFAKLQEIPYTLVNKPGYSSMAGHALPDLEGPMGAILKKKVLGAKYGAPSFKIHSSSYASKWNGEPKYVSWYA